MSEYPTGIQGELQANALFIALVGAENATLPEVDLFDETHTVPWDLESAILDPIEKLKVAELVENFQAVMASVGLELQKEFDANRITGAKYADTYLALTQGALQMATQFTLGKDQAFWMAAKTQADAIASNNQNENIRLQAMLQRATFALTKMKLSESDSAFGASEYQRENILPAQKTLLAEQMEAQRAQTLSTRSDAVTTVAGLIGKQMELYAQQKTSYQDDTRIKATRIFSDLWTAQHTIDEGVPPAAAFSSEDLVTNPSDGRAEAFNAIFTAIRTKAIT